MTFSPDRLRRLHGTEAPLSIMRTLRAGPVTMVLDGVDLRYLRIGGTELVRRIYTAVRDVDWDTVPGVVTGLELEERDRGFRLEFDVRHARREVDFSWRGTITGDEAGRVEFVFDGKAEQGFPYNRIGICLHSPWREAAGARFTARTPEGDLAGSFPDLIGPQGFSDGAYRALFPAFDRLEVELGGGGNLLLEFEGDLWEAEDHRNWTDANFKIYAMPIALGRPAPLAAGQGLRQRLVVTPVDVPAGAVETGPVRLSVGAPTGTVVPPVGLAVDRDGHRPADDEVALLAGLGPHHLRVEVRLDRDDWAAALHAAQETARRLGTTLEVALMLRDEHVSSLASAADALAAGPPVDRVLVTLAGGRTATPEETTPAGLVGLVRGVLGESLPGASFVGGTEIYFTEINRTRPDHATWDGVCYSLTPQIHAFTDVDVMESLDAQAETLRSAHAIAAGKPVVISPITLRRRVNFHAAGEPPPTPAGELPDSVDVRQSALLGGAWTAGSLKYISEAGAASVTYYESTGWRGVVERATGSELPDRFRSRAGEAFPLYHPLADVAGWCGATVLSCASSDLLAAVGLAVRDDDGRVCLLVANLTAHAQDVVVGPLQGPFALRRLNEATAERAGGEPAAFRSESERSEADGDLALELEPYEVVRVDPLDS